MSDFLDLVDFVIYRTEVLTGSTPTSDPVVREVRRELREVFGWRAVKAIHTMPGAVVYFLGLIIPAAVDLERVNEALWVGGNWDDTINRLVQFVLDRRWPYYAYLSGDIAETIAPFYWGGDAVPATRRFASRVWSFLPEAVVDVAATITHIYLMSKIRIAAGLRADWGDPDNDELKTPSDWSRGAPSRLGAAAHEALLQPLNTRECNRDRNDGDAAVDLRLLVGSAFDFQDPLSRKGVNLALTFGYLLCERLAADLGVDADASWCDRVAVIGFCATLPAVAEALKCDELVEATTLIAIARRVDATSGDGHLVQTIATGNPNEILGEFTLALKSTITEAGIAVSDQAFALFPARLAASSELATRTAAIAVRP